MKERVISGVVIAALIIVTGYVGGYALLAFMFVCSSIAFTEMVRALGGAEEGRKINAGTAAGLAANTAYYICLAVKGNSLETDHAFAVILILLVIALMVSYVLRFPGSRDRQVTSVVFSFVYIPYFISFAYRARVMPYGKYLLCLIFFSAWISDSCAYFAGRAFGRHKLAPVLSPKKTVEGSIGGIAGSSVSCLIAAVVLRALHPTEQYLAVFALIGAVGSVISQIGDLAASAIKRTRGIKDYGSIIPGHGGMMDRFDSGIFTAPVVYLLASLLMELNG